MSLAISIDSSLKEIIKLGVVQFSQVQVMSKIEALVQEMRYFVRSLAINTSPLPMRWTS